MKHLAPVTFAVAVTLAVPVLAQDVFIRPKDSDNRPSIGELGIRPKQPPKPVVAPPVEAQPASQDSAPATKPPAPTQVVAQPPSPVEPVGLTGADEGLSFLGGGGNIQTSQVGGVEIMQVSSSNEPVPQGSGRGVLNFSVKPGALGNDDKQRITSALGLTEKEIMSNCFFQYSLLVSYGQEDGELIPMRGNTPVRYKYTPPLGTVEVMPTISCRKLRAPLVSTIEENGFYTVGIGSVQCEPGQRANAGFVTAQFTYAGDGNGQCVFQ